MNIDVIVRNRNNDKTGGEENEKNPWYCFSYNRNLAALFGIVLKLKENTAISIIGGADGPTSIYVAGKISNIPSPINSYFFL